MTEEHKNLWKTFTKEIEVSGHQFAGRSRGVIVGGIAVIAASWLALIGAITGLAAKV